MSIEVATREVWRILGGSDLERVLTIGTAACAECGVPPGRPAPDDQLLAARAGQLAQVAVLNRPNADPAHVPRPLELAALYRNDADEWALCIDRYKPVVNVRLAERFQGCHIRDAIELQILVMAALRDKMTTARADASRFDDEAAMSRGLLQIADERARKFLRYLDEGIFFDLVGLQNGDDQAWSAAVVGHFGRTIQNKVNRHCADMPAADREDVISRILCNFQQTTIHACRRPEDVLAFLWKEAEGDAINAWRRFIRDRNRVEPLGEDAEPPRAPLQAEPPPRLTRADFLRLLELTRLNLVERAVMVQYKLDDQTPEEVAEALGISVTSVFRIACEARAKLRRFIKGPGGRRW